MKLVNVKKTYENGICAVKNFSLDIQPQDFIVLVGPSGCGKTTVLKMIAKIIKQDEGTIDVADASMVFQFPALFGHMSVLENILIGKKDENQAMQIAKIMGITSLLNQKANTLSGGQSQKVALARALMKDSPLILMDEPCSHLDEKSKEFIQNEILQIHKKLKNTILYVTHDQKEAMKMASRLVVMKEGEIQQIGSPQEVYMHPANEFVAHFFGMNVFENKAIHVEDVIFKEESNEKAFVVSSQFQGKEYMATIQYKGNILKMIDTTDRSGQTIGIELRNIIKF